MLGEAGLEGLSLRRREIAVVCPAAQERQFADPDSLQIDRPKAGSQLAFGAGVHFCIGAPLARQELNLGFATLLDRVSRIELDTDAEPPEAEPSFILRNLPKLKVKLTWR